MHILQPVESQTSWPSSLPENIRAALQAETQKWGPLTSVRHSENSNVVTELQFANRQSLLVKQARHYPEYTAVRFQACREAARLIKAIGIIAPIHLNLALPDTPVMAYRKINLPTLDQVWRQLPETEQTMVLRSLGRLLRRIHQISLPEYGLPFPSELNESSLEKYLQNDLEHRLRPAVYAEWKNGLRAVDALINSIPRIAGRVDGPPVLNHNDLHMGNILCHRRDEKVRCAGVIDLEAAVAGPPEIDFARLSVYHGPLFGKPLNGLWFERIWEGYGMPLDPVLLAYFRAYHLVNIGLHTAINVSRAHALNILRAAQDDLGAFSRRQCAVRSISANASGNTLSSIARAARSTS